MLEKLVIVWDSSAEDLLSGKKVAIKKIPNAFNDLTDAKRILREIKLMRHFEHEGVSVYPFASRWAARKRAWRPQVIRVEDLQPPPSLAEFEDVYIISELMETDLHRIIYSRQVRTMRVLQGSLC